MSEPSENPESSPQGGLDRFTRNYLIVLGSVAGLILIAWIASWNPRVGEINALLEADPLVSAYPYRFHVMVLDNGIAQVSTPRSFDVPVMRFLTIIHPELNGKAQDDPAMMAAQDELVKVQKRVAQIVRSQPDVKGIRWVLDREWYSSHGLSPNR